MAKKILYLPWSEYVRPRIIDGNVEEDWQFIVQRCTFTWELPLFVWIGESRKARLIVSPKIEEFELMEVDDV